MKGATGGGGGAQLVTVAEACRLLASSRTAVYGMMDRGELEYVKLGRSRRVRLAALEALVERNTVARRPAK